MRTLLLFALQLLHLTMVPAHAVLLGHDAQKHPIAKSTILVVSKASGWCSGIVIDDQTILTAAQCVFGKGEVGIAFRQNDQFVTISARSTAMHPQFRHDAVTTRSVSFDAALLRLQARLPSDFRAASFTLEAPVEGTKVTVAGFGVTDEASSQTGGRLHLADIQIVEPYGRGKVVSWAKDGRGSGRGICLGDAGGPQFLSEGPNAGRIFAINVWSTGLGGRSCGVFSQAIRVSAIADWVIDTMRVWGLAAPADLFPASQSPASTNVTAPAIQPPNVARHGVELLGSNAFGELMVRISGEMTRDAIAAFQNAVGEERRVVVFLEGPGGNLSAGIEIGTRIRLRGYRTVVAPGKACASACAVAWLGGSARHMDVTAAIGFHAAYIDDNGRQIESGVANALVGAYANRLGMNDRAIIFITSAGPASMNWLAATSPGAAGIDFVVDRAQ